ncbi:unnamed protein product [Linum tenue]|uniref:DUF1664 domain-containing protein n=1 Tax=Linum tenue TaxID=586396 RepID=A0AAV0S310_9ROSI|nr:unnamed protein product [Linum tenue]
MALPLGKLVILAGAGLIGASTVYGKDSGITDWLFGASKIWKQLKKDTGSGKKPQNDSLMAQVNSLRQELQLLASNGPVTIITSGGAGANKYYIIVVGGVIGCGYVWWKGWKLPDMMFATRRTLSDACNSVAQQLETVYASLRTTRKELSAGISNLDTKLTEIEKSTDSTQGIVVQLLEGSGKIGKDFHSFKERVESLKSRVDNIAVKQVESISGIQSLLAVAHQSALPPAADGLSSRPATSDPSPEVEQTPRRIVSPPSTQQGNGVAGVTELTSQGIWNGIFTPEVTNGGESSSSSSVLQRPSSFLSRVFSSTTEDVVDAFKMN